MEATRLETAPEKPRDAVGIDWRPTVIESLHTPWWMSLREGFRALLQPEDKTPLPRYRDAEPGEPTLGPMMLDSVHGSWFQNLREYFRLSKAEKNLPQFQATSQPVAVRNIWGEYDNRKRSLPISLLVHGTVILLIFTVFRAAPMSTKSGSVTLIVPVDIQPYLAALQPRKAAGDAGGGGGGGLNQPLPPSKGRLPRFDMQQLTPPSPVIRNEAPKLSVEPTIVMPDDAAVPNIDMAILGDPLGKIGPPSAGPGLGGGIGSGQGGGVGSGRGSGVGPGEGGGFGGGVFRVGGGVSAPRLTRKVEPEYSEEARKAKYQGTVRLQVEVWPDGRAHNIRVVRSLGLGLDEKAIQAVQQWEFVPGKKDGESVKVAATIEVNFRLL
jgi:periplasmic protein TonB